MNTITAKIKALLTGEHVEEEKKVKHNPYPNGPVKYKTMTNGQARRSDARARRRTQERNYRDTRKAYMNREAERAVLRGMLQVLGVVKYVSHQEPTEARITRAQTWVADNYGSLDNAVKRYENLSGEKISA